MLFLNDLELKRRTVFLRADFNVPLDDSGAIRDDTRIRAVLPTLKYLLEQGARVVAASHLGRPKGKVVPELSLRPVAEALDRLIPGRVLLAPDVIGDEVDKLKKELDFGEVLLLENLRFYKEETENDACFAQKLAEGIDAYVNDAFGACHRAHASVVAITQHVPKKAAGFLVSKEVEYLQMAVDSPQRPYVAILGGAKVSDKIPIIESLLNLADTLLIGGAMAYTFLAARGLEVGRSLVERDKLDMAARLLETASSREVRVELPSDHIAAAAIAANADRTTLTTYPFPQELMALDIGPDTIRTFSGIISSARTIFWNGPMGVFEVEPFDRGTVEIARAVASSHAMSIVGGGDSVAAIDLAGVRSAISHISTGGGASLEYISHQTLPGIEALNGG